MAHEQHTIGDLIQTLYSEYMALYDDEELVSVAVAATVNEVLAERARASRADPHRGDAAA